MNILSIIKSTALELFILSVLLFSSAFLYDRIFPRAGENYRFLDSLVYDPTNGEVVTEWFEADFIFPADTWEA